MHFILHIFSLNESNIPHVMESFSKPRSFRIELLYTLGSISGCFSCEFPSTNRKSLSKGVSNGHLMKGHVYMASKDVFVATVPIVPYVISLYLSPILSHLSFSWADFLVRISMTMHHSNTSHPMSTQREDEDPYLLIVSYLQPVLSYLIFFLSYPILS